MIQALVDWFETSQRALPWRESYDPYHVWVSEVMLQQTQMETALPYYARFLERFPSLKDFASADEGEALRVWSGLGYYRRVKNFRKAAIQVIQSHGGKVPSDYNTLLSLPGIGPYTAGAIMSIAFNQPYPIVDGNIRRVLSRLHGWSEENPRSIWNAAQEVVHSAEPRVVNQAMMELGATICSFKTPDCQRCPIVSHCKAYAAGVQENIPAPRKRQKAVQIRYITIIDRDQSGVLMREVDGFWEFPTFDELPEGAFEKVGKCRHTVTHHQIAVDVYTGKIGYHNGYHRVYIEPLPITSLTRKIQALAHSEV